MGSRPDSDSKRSETAIDVYAPAFLGLLATRVVDRLVEDGARIAKAQGISVPPRCMSTIMTLAKGPIGVSEISRQLGVSHVAVIQHVRQLADLGLVRTLTDPNDARRKPVELTAKGKQAAREVAQFLEAAQQVYRDIFAETGTDVYEALTKIESTLNRISFFERMEAATAK
jgi:DNA-binding MarR family transcriptional regulator